MTGFDATGKLGTVFETLDSFVSGGQLNAAAVAIAYRGEQVGEHHVGEAAPGIAADHDTLWPLASISKLYTAAVIMALVERGVITLSMTVTSVLPAFDGDGREQVTLRHLLTHTSGIVYESPEMEQRLLDQWSIEQITEESYAYALLFEPGSRHSYSDYNYALLGAVAAQASGMPFTDLVHSLVLEPGRLADTFMPPPKSEYPRLARVVGPFAEGTESDMYNSPYALNLAHPAFGTVASVSDVLRFGLLFTPNGSRRILSEATVRAMTRDQTGGRAPGGFPGLDAGAPMPWGFGFHIKGNLGGHGDLLSPESFGHGGASGCVLQVDPTNDVAVAYVSNKHARTGRPPFTRRQVSIVNTAIAALTRRG
ncbi:MAG TPA: serine hydrolase domain-containing protein [Thermomicrobiales bacterium]|nr:serine hydrolase domain-containing protein [Thermomicrobiales bacterium]